MALYKKLLELQSRVKSITKDKQGNGYSYLSGDKLFDIVRPIMDDIGLLLIPEVEDAHFERIDYNTKNGAKSEMFCALKMRFTWIDTETGEKEVVPWASTGMNAWDKSIGSALTYGERYFVMKFLHLSTDEDDVDAIKTPQEEVNVQNAIANINTAADAGTMQQWLTYFQQNFPAIAKDRDFLLAYNNKMRQINGTGKKQ